VLFKPPKLTLDAAVRDVRSKDPRVRAAAANALGDASEEDRPRAAEALMGVLSDDRYEVRVAAALALGDLGDRSAVEPLIEKLEDVHSEVRQSAAIALGRLGDERGFAPLAAALAEGSADLRFQAAASLVEIDPQRAYDPLVAAVGDGDAEVRANVAAALGEIGEKRAAGWIADLLEDAAPDVRFEAAYALARFGDARAVEPLIGFLGDAKRQYETIEALEMIGDRRASTYLATILGKLLTARLIRVRAAAALLKIEPEHTAAPQARKLLEKAARSGREEIAGLATESLERLSGSAQP
jgi:HEAT repeat protein